MQFWTVEKFPEIDELVLEIEQNLHSETYRKLIREFYLKKVALIRPIAFFRSPKQRFWKSGIFIDTKRLF